ncbi:MAG: hypothetical protein KDC67_16540 [Ignavibacteriae bacterium]|nr:hypothetical protein [Ignavibacteriota bacterium]
MRKIILLITFFSFCSCNGQDKKTEQNQGIIEKTNQKEIMSDEQYVLNLLNNSYHINENASENDKLNAKKINDLIMSKSNFTEIPVEILKKDNEYFVIALNESSQKFKFYILNISTLEIKKQYEFDSSFEQKIKQVKIIRN